VSVNLPPLGELRAVPGVRLASACAGIKQSERDDVALREFAHGTQVSGVFTRNSFRAPPVDIAAARVGAGDVRAMLINSGNANAATGEEGHADALALCALAASQLDLSAEQVIPFSTGVIGERLPVAKIGSVLPQCAQQLDENAWPDVARAIMTTDTAPKAQSATVELDGRTVTMTGIAKGAGMIKPDMATMLAYLCCDALISTSTLNQLVKEVADASFNRITIDGDTSTNDSFMLVATGAAENSLISDVTSPHFLQLKQALIDIAQLLAQSVVRDGEGASKFVTVRVNGGASEAECLDVAYTVAESPLVKTALFASDPNWGRLCMAIGRAGVEDLDQSGVVVHLDDVCIVSAGCAHPDYTEARGAEVMARDEQTITIDLGRGEYCSEIWTSDLSYEYVRINAEYRT
jgi:glutamate N-acetyltransferase/amino-acid N-acetyltransferase